MTPSIPPNPDEVVQKLSSLEKFRILDPPQRAGVVHVVEDPPLVRKGDVVEIEGRRMKVKDIERFLGSEGCPQKYAFLTDDVWRPEGIDSEIAQHVEQCDELGLYLFARNTADMMKRLGQEAAPFQVKHNDVDFTEVNDTMLSLRTVMRYTAEQTKRFGVEEPIETAPSQILGGKPVIKPSADYTRWFMWWHTYISDMPDEWWEEVKGRIEADKPTDDVRPTGTWKAPEGVIPKKWLTFKIDAEQLEILPQTHGFDATHRKYAALLDHMRHSDELWHFLDPEGSDEGLAIVSMGRPTAMIKFEDLR